MGKKTANLNIRIDTATLRALRKASKDEQRTITAIVLDALEKRLKARLVAA